MPPSSYLLDNAAAAAGPRMDALAQLFDASTFRHIEALGIAPGWRATADEIARHLASVDAGVLDLATPPMISAWGRRPA